MPTMATLFTHWKSSLQGILMLVLTTCGVLITSGILNADTTKIVALVSALAFAYIGLISKDSGVTVASVSGAPPVAVTSHEVPDDPKAKAVK
jgi:hypothetical protein